MKNENRAVFDRGPEPIAYAFELPTNTSVEPQEIRSRHVAAPDGAFVRLLRWIGAKLRARRNRIALLELSDDQLKDIGISRSQAYGDYSRHRQSQSRNLERRCQ